jgi:GT2 family glycosyltransferase
MRRDDAEVSAAGPRLSVIIPTLDNYELLERVLDAYDRQTARADDFELILAVDAAEPDPHRVEVLTRGRSYAVKWVDGLTPGAAANRNAGIRAAAAPVILFSDNDTVPGPELVAQHLDWHDRHPDETVAVLGRIEWAPDLRVTTFMHWLGGMDAAVPCDLDEERGPEVSWNLCVTANWSLKRALIERVGGFDELRFPYGYEDIEWAYRASKAGLRVLYNRAAVVQHVRPMTLEFWQRRARRVAAAEFRFHSMYPGLEPWFYTKFDRAIRKSPPRARKVTALGKYFPRKLPWLGARVWGSVDTTYSQAIAPYFLRAWAEAQAAPTQRVIPDLSEFTERT